MLCSETHTYVHTNPCFIVGVVRMTYSAKRHAYQDDKISRLCFRHFVINCVDVIMLQFP